MGGGAQHEVSRRSALTLIGAAGVIAASPAALALAGPQPADGDSLRLALPGATPSQSFQVIRTADMVYVQVNFYNTSLAFKSGVGYVIVPASPAITAYLTAVFPSQHMGEEVLQEPLPAEDDYPTLPLRAALAGPSWLTFQLKPTSAIPLTVAGLLDWSELIPVTGPGKPNEPPTPPDLNRSALEVPWSMWLTPPQNGTWHHSPTPVTSSGRTELWHTRLGVGGVEPPGAEPLIRALWTTSYNLGAQPDPWPMSLTAPDGKSSTKDAIVYLTSPNVPGGAPVTARFLALSALGASIDVSGDWSNTNASPYSITQWVHRASTGRDSYVRVASAGYLCPFGHRALYVTVTDREFHVSKAGDTVAFLIQRSYVVPQQRVVSYDGDPAEPNGGRGNPMRTVEVKVVSTPPVSATANPVSGLSPTELAFWVTAADATTPLPFAFTATDAENRTVDFTTPVIWFSTETVQDVGVVIDAYNAATTANPEWVTPTLGGALFAFADVTGAKAGSTAYHTDTYTLNGAYSANNAASCYPVLASPGAVIHLPGVAQVTGRAVSAPSVVISQNYLNGPFQPGKPEVFLQVTQNPPGLKFPVQNAGALAPPNLDAHGIARDIGPVGGSLSNMVNGTFNAADYFGSASGGVGTLLGAISIADLVGGTTAGAAAVGQAPQITTVSSADAVDTTLNWNPGIADGPIAKGAFKKNVNGNTNFLITAKIHTPIQNPAKVTYTVHGELTNFTLVIFGTGADFIDITFTSLTFDAKTGAKPAVSPQISGVTFGDQLSFIGALAQLFSSLGGPSVTATSDGIAASYTLAVPDVSLGVFSLANVALSAVANIPFDGTPVRFRFALSSQENPFLLTIYLFGGGGFLSLAVGADGLEQIQVSLEFGAAVSIDLGVASGGVSIMAGIYFNYQTGPPQKVALTGFLRADGNLSVLGIITISMEFYLGFTYQDPGAAYGEAQVTVSVSVLFFSASVSVTMKKTIGGGSDPDFKDAISRPNWLAYCGAFG